MSNHSHHLTRAPQSCWWVSGARLATQTDCSVNHVLCFRRGAPTEVVCVFIPWRMRSFLSCGSQPVYQWPALQPPPTPPFEYVTKQMSCSLIFSDKGCRCISKWENFLQQLVSFHIILHAYLDARVSSPVSVNNLIYGALLVHFKCASANENWRRAAELPHDRWGKTAAAAPLQTAGDSGVAALSASSPPHLASLESFSPGGVSLAVCSSCVNASVSAETDSCKRWNQHLSNVEYFSADSASTISNSSKVLCFLWWSCR